MNGWHGFFVSNDYTIAKVEKEQLPGSVVIFVLQAMQTPNSEKRVFLLNSQFLQVHFL